MAKKIHGQSLSSAPVSPALKSRSAPSRDSRWAHKGKHWPDAVAERDTYLIYHMWSDGGGLWVRLEMQSFAVVVVVVVSCHFPPGTPFGWHHLRRCKHNVMWNIQQRHMSDAWAGLECIVTNEEKHFRWFNTEIFGFFWFQAWINTARDIVDHFIGPVWHKCELMWTGLIDLINPPVL